MQQSWNWTMAPGKNILVKQLSTSMFVSGCFVLKYIGTVKTLDHVASLYTDNFSGSIHRRSFRVCFCHKFNAGNVDSCLISHPPFGPPLNPFLMGGLLIKSLH